MLVANVLPKCIANLINEQVHCLRFEGMGDGGRTTVVINGRLTAGGLESDTDVNSLDP